MTRCPYCNGELKIRVVNYIITNNDYKDRAYESQASADPHNTIIACQCCMYARRPTNDELFKQKNSGGTNALWQRNRELAKQ